MANGGSPFATFLIVGPVCFFLGIIFATFPYDYYVLWAAPPAGETDEDFYFSLLERHLKFMFNSPPIVGRILHTVLGTGIVGILIKLYKPSEANMLFDGATMVLYMISTVIYITNTLKGLRMVDSGEYGPPVVEGEPSKSGDVVGREDSLRVMAATNTISALVLMGVLVLQAGQWYAQKKEAAEIEAIEKAADENKASKEKGRGATASKKKQ